MTTRSAATAEKQGTHFDPSRYASEPEAVRSEREAAYRRWEEMPAPSRMDEAWRRSDPRWFDPAGLPVAPAPQEGGAGFDDPVHALYDVVVVVDASGYAIQDRSGVLSAGRLQVRPLARALNGSAGSGERADQPSLPEDVLKPDRFEVWADAFWNAGFQIDVPAGAELERGVLVDYRIPDGGVWYGNRLRVRVGDGARFHVAERMTGGNGGRSVVNSRREVFAGASSRVRVVTLQTLAGEAAVQAWDGARIAGHARVDWATFPMGGGAVRTRFASELTGPEAEAGMFSLVFGDGNQRIEQDTLQVHSAPDTRSTLLYKGLVKDEARSLFQGVIVARRGAQRIDAYQKNNHLVLNDGARADSLPGLLIDADDLRCSHGATVGTLDPDQMHYLRCRGLSHAQASRLLIHGFSGDILEKLPYDALRDAVRAVVDRKIG